MLLKWCAVHQVAGNVEDLIAVDFLVVPQIVVRETFQRLSFVGHNKWHLVESKVVFYFYGKY
jgi:hypothetical protein